MPKSTMEDEPQWKLPKETPLLATLTEVKEKVIKWTDKNTQEKKERTKWEWVFKIKEPSDYSGLQAWGETDSKITNHPDSLARQFAEALTGTEFHLGDGFDTDDVVGTSCVITVDNASREKPDGSMFYSTPVLEVFPEEMWATLSGTPDF